MGDVINTVDLSAADRRSSTLVSEMEQLMFDGLLKHILGRNSPIRKPNVGFPNRNHVCDPIAILRLVIRVNCPPPRSNHGTRGRGCPVAVGSQSNFLGKDEILDRSTIFQDLLPGRITVLFDPAKVFGPEQDSRMPVSGVVCLFAA
jgi:hypothetical protein